MIPNITSEYPPKDIYDKCVEQFGVDFTKGVVFAVNDTIHIYEPEEMTEDLLVHESVHIKQQAEMGYKIWWDKYLTDPEFRLKQETEAYQAQYQYSKEHHIRDHRRFLMDLMSRNLAGAMYGNLLTQDEAKQIIKDETPR